MCESGADELSRTLDALGKCFSDLLYSVDWINIGGGQLFTEEHYDIEKAINSLNVFQKQFNVRLYMEPCTAIMYKAGCFITTVVDIVNTNIPTVILDSSAICHLPDIVFFPYRSDVKNASLPFEQSFTYRLAGASCYSGDIFGDYSFDTPLRIGDRIVFEDTAPYSLVKSSWFNGIPFPKVAIQDSDENVEIIKEYGYKEYKTSL